MNKTYQVSAAGISISTACRAVSGLDGDTVGNRIKYLGGSIAHDNYCTLLGGDCSLNLPDGPGWINVAGGPVFGEYSGTGTIGGCTACQPECQFGLENNGYIIAVYRVDATTIAAEIIHGIASFGFFPHLLSFQGSVAAKCDALKIRIPNLLTGAGTTESVVMGGGPGGAVAIGSGGFIDLVGCCKLPPEEDL
jgi:hypothetical protein